MKKLVSISLFCICCSLIGKAQSVAPPIGDTIVLLNYDTNNCQFAWKIIHSAGDSIAVSISDNVTDTTVMDTVIVSPTDSGVFTIHRQLLANWPYLIVMKVKSDTSEWTENTFYTYVATAVQNIPAINDLAVFSFNHTLYVRSASDYVGGSVTLFNSIGEEIFQKTITSSDALFSTTVPTGIYLVTIRKPGVLSGIVTKKLFIEGQ